MFTLFTYPGAIVFNPVTVTVPTATATYLLTATLQIIGSAQGTPSVYFSFSLHPGTSSGFSREINLITSGV